jgi:polar amino acid transport system substrate-binding protein
MSPSRMVLRAALLVVASLLLITAQAPAAKADLLKDILDRGVIRIGTTMDNPPYGSYDAAGKPVGFDIEFGQMIGQAMGVKVEVVSQVMANRIPMLLTKKVDILVSSFGLVPSRALQVMYSEPYTNNLEALWGPASIKITGPNDLGTLKIAAGVGTIQDKALTAMAPKANIVRFDSDATTVTAYVSGQADLMVGPATLAKQVNDAYPQHKLEMKFPLLSGTSHIGVPQGEFTLLQFLNTYIYYLRVNNLLQPLTLKYFGQDLGNLPPF